MTGDLLIDRFEEEVELKAGRLKKKGFKLKIAISPAFNKKYLEYSKVKPVEGKPWKMRGLITMSGTIPVEVKNQKKDWILNTVGGKKNAKDR